MILVLRLAGAPYARWRAKGQALAAASFRRCCSWPCRICAASSALVSAIHDNGRDDQVLNRLRPDAERYQRRMARIARWDRPLSGRFDRVRAWTNMLLVDHGIF